MAGTGEGGRVIYYKENFKYQYYINFLKLSFEINGYVYMH